MNQPAADALRPPTEGGSGRALLLALLMHLLLLVLIAFGVHWRSHTPQAVEAELWAPTARLSAPPPPPPQPVAQPRPAPKPVPKVAPPPPPPAPQAQTRPQPDQAEIALREKRKLEQQQRAKRAEELAQQQAQKRAEQQHEKQLEQQRLAAQKAAEQKAAAAKAAAEKAAAEKAAAEKAAAEKAAAEKAAKERAARLAAERRRAAELARLQQQSRQDYLKSLMTQAGTGASPGGTAAATAGPSGGYAARLATLIRQNVIYPQIDQINGNPKVTLSVTLDPNSGQVLGVSVEHSSGVPSWDQAVVRAVKRLGTLPSDHGRWWTPMEVVAGPRDQAG